MLGRAIKHVRHQPRHVRDKYAFGIAAGVTLLIVLVWVFGLPARLASLDADSNVVESEPVFSSFISEMSNGLSDVGEAVSELSEEIDSVPDATESLTASSSAQVDLDLFADVPRTIRIATTTASTTQ